MMSLSDTIAETKKRLDLADAIAADFADVSLGIVIVGSVAYAPHLNVTSKFDLDMIIVANNLKSVLSHLDIEQPEKDGLRNRYFDGYSIKYH